MSLRNPEPEHSQIHAFPRWMKALFVLIFLAIFYGGTALYRSQEKIMGSEVEIELASIAQIKIHQISLWITDQIDDAAEFASDPLLKKILRQYENEPTAAHRKTLLQYLRNIAKQGESSDIVLVSDTGEYILSLSGEFTLDLPFRQAFQKVLETHQPEFIALHLHTDSDSIPDLGLVTPVIDKNGSDSTLLGALVLSLDPTHFLFPLVQSWPTLSETGEAYLVTRSGDDILYLNDLRYHPHSALKFSLPVSRSDLPSAMALSGKTGIVTGRDYRGVEVTAYIKPVPNSEWFLVSKVDSEEVYADWRSHSGFILVLLAGLIMLSLAGGIILWQRNLNAHFRKLYQTEMNLRVETERHGVTMRAIGEGVITTDIHGLIEFMNPAAEMITGWEASQAIGRPLQDIYTIINKNDLETNTISVSDVIADGIAREITGQFSIITRDGREIPVAEHVAPINDDQGKICGAVLTFRDLTEEQRSHILVELRLKLFDYASDHSIDELLVKTLDEACEYTGSTIGFYHFVEDDQETILLQQWSTKTKAEYCQATGEPGHYPLSEAGVWADCIREKRPIIHNDYASLPGTKGLPEGHAELIREVVVPVVREGKVVAVMGLGNRPADYTEADLESVIYLADIAWAIITQKRADMRIHNFAANWSRTFDASQDAIALLDINQRIIQSNQVFKELFNKTDDDVNNHFCYNIVHGCNQSFEYCPFIKMLKSTQRETIELEMNDQIYRVMVDPIRDEQGVLTGAVHFLTNITEQVHAARSIVESEEKYRNLVEASPDALLLHFNGIIQFANAAALTIFEASGLDEILGTKVVDLVHPDYQNIISQRIQTIVNQKSIAPVLEEKLLTLKGRVFDAEVSGVPINLDGQKGVQVIVRDISERKRLEETQQLQNQQLNLIFNSVADSIYFLAVEPGPKFRIVSVNPAFLAMTGATAEELVGQTLDAVIPESSFYMIQANLEKAIAEKQTVIWEDTLKFPTGLKSEITSVSPVFNSEGVCTHLIGSIQDITNQKKAEVEHEKLRDQLSQSQKLEAVGRLAGGIAHDYNNMLSVISGHAEMALERLDQPKAVESDIKGIIRATYRSAEITRQLLTFARQQTISPMSLDLNYAIEQALEMLHRLIHEEIELDWRPGKDIWAVKIDPSQIDQILTNLCVNARDAISGIGKIIIETGNVIFDKVFCDTHPGSSPGEYVVIAVSDNGSGMDSETADQIFEPFFTTKEVGKGTGLGLATVYGIVQQNNGFITVTSQPGLGTTFKIFLRRFEGDAQRQPQLQRGEINSSKGETIMIIEDEPEVLEMSIKLLKSLGYTVIAAGSPHEALEKLNTQKPRIDLLMTDVVMPEMNGREIADRIQKLYPSIKVVFMSGYPANVIANRGVLNDGVNYLPKPFTIQELGTKLRLILDPIPELW